ncbi:MAG: lysylphosphatidylglycerol synthase transmembrane domain-containing protein [Gemmatimonadales bacterium]
MKVWLKVAVSVTLLTIILIILPWSDVWASLSRLSTGVWLGVLAGFLAGHLVGVFKWRLFVNAGRAALKPVDATLCYSAGLFANLCLPTIVGGDVLRAALAGRLSRRTEAAIWGGVMDRITDISALAVLITIGGIASRGSLPGWGSTVLTVLVVVGIAGTLIFLPLILRRPLNRWPARFRRPIGRSLVALRRLIRRPAIGATGFVMSLTIQGGFVLLNAWLGRAIGIELPLAVWFFAWPLAKIAGLIPISLGGLAVREASLAAILLPFGVPAARAVVCSLLWQTVLIVGGLAGGLVWLVLSRRRRDSNGELKGITPSVAISGQAHG